MFLEIIPNVVINSNYIISIEIKENSLAHSDAPVMFVHMTNNKTYAVSDNGHLFHNIYKALETTENRFLFTD